MERVIRKCNEWKVLNDFNADQIEDFVAWLDCVIALVNLRTLDNLNRLREIPKEEPAGVAHRYITKEEVPGLPRVKFDLQPPTHFQKLLDDGPNFAKRDWAKSFRPVALERAKSRINSCYVLQINCCELDGGSFMISFENAASAQSLTYLGGLVVAKENFFLHWACACTAGRESIDDEDEEDEVVGRGEVEKGGCSHIAAGLELLTQIQEAPETFEYVVRKRKGKRLDGDFRHMPLKDAWNQLEEARNRVYIGKEPLDNRQPTPVCVCRKSHDAYANGIKIVCSNCMETFHHKCLAMSKNLAGKLENDWQCGFCVGADNDGSNFGVGRGHDDVQNDVEEQDVQQTWTIRMKVRKQKKQTCYWGRTGQGSHSSLVRNSSIL